MALIKFELSPAWKRVSDDEMDETETMDGRDEPAATEAPRRVEVVDEAPAKRRRLLTLRRLLGLGVVVGAVVMARRLSKTASTMVEQRDEPTIDVEAADETPAE